MKNLNKKKVLLFLTVVIVVGLYVTNLYYKNSEPVSKDTIYKMIEEKYPNSKIAQAAAKQKADAYIRIANGDENYNEINIEGNKAMACIDAVAPEYSHTMYKWLEETVFDNYQRYYLYEKYNHSFNGKIVSIPAYGVKGCKFDPSLLPN